MHIKYLPDRTNVLSSPIDTSIKEGDSSCACKFVAHHRANLSPQIQGVDFDHSYSPMSHSESFRINITIVAIHRLSASILDVSNAFQNTNVPIHEIVCVSPPPYYLDWFEKYYPDVPVGTILFSV